MDSYEGDFRWNETSSPALETPSRFTQAAFHSCSSSLLLRGTVANVPTTPLLS